MHADGMSAQRRRTAVCDDVSRSSVRVMTDAFDPNPAGWRRYRQRGCLPDLDARGLQQ